MTGLELLVLASGLAFVAAGGVVGVRLLQLAGRTRGLPERVIGFSLLMLAAVSWPLMLVVSAPEPPAAWIQRSALVGASVAMALGWSGVFVFTWRVFRPGDGWARLLAGIGIGLELGAGMAMVLRALTLEDASALRHPATAGLLLLVGAQVVYVWSAAESFRYRALLRRRIPLGLADPLVANRVGLWGWTAVFAGGSIAPSTAAMLSGGDPHAPLNHLVVGVCGLVCSGALTLAFLPPAWYVRHVRGNTQVQVIEGAP